MNMYEENVTEKLRNAIPNMTDFQKGYMLGMVERNASDVSKKEFEEERRNNEGSKKSGKGTAVCKGKKRIVGDASDSRQHGN